ncbi:DinB family protein [Pedobacter psychrodurus]|uniref:DinB family protein n=1 Tax=Pedobacter psychrodurus TaxID=2530456 RepID=UPI00292F7916|nr:DinB family protein [Pedobacter psychrodurus]
MRITFVRLIESAYVIMENQKSILVTELKKLLNGGGAHVGFKDAVANLSFNLLGEKPHNLPYSIWQLAEHIKIAQWDMLEFSKDGSHQSPKWPDEYWPKELAPKDEETWNNTLKQIDDDLKAFIALLDSADLFEAIPHGDGQSVLREALQIADHNAYHIAEIVVIRRLLGAWKS